MIHGVSSTTTVSKSWTVQGFLVTRPCFVWKQGGVPLSYKNRQVLSDLDITSPTWLENSQEMDNITYGLHPSLKHKNLTNGQRCPSFSPNSTLITFDCDALSTAVCQLKHSNTERGKGQFGCFSHIEIKIRFHFY